MQRMVGACILPVVMHNLYSSTLLYYPLRMVVKDPSNPKREMDSTVLVVARNSTGTKYTRCVYRSVQLESSIAVVLVLQYGTIT
jgi:hypothetical protein